MAQNEKTSARVSAIASRALQNPQSLNADEIKELAASVLTQSADHQKSQQNFQNQQSQSSQSQQKR
jgi:hypothetical protein